MIVVLTALGAIAVVGGQIGVATNMGRGGSSRGDVSSDSGVFIADDFSSDHHRGPGCGHAEHGGDGGGDGEAEAGISAP